MKITGVRWLADDLLMPIYDDLNPKSDLVRYTDDEEVQQLLADLGPYVTAYFNRVYRDEIAEYIGKETDYIAQAISDEALDIYQYINEWERLQSRPRCGLIIEDITNIPAAQRFKTTVYPLKIKSRENWQPIMRLYMLQIDDGDEEGPWWVFLFAGCKFEYNIKDCPGIVSSLHRRVELVIKYLIDAEILEDV